MSEFPVPDAVAGSPAATGDHGWAVDPVRRARLLADVTFALTTTLDVDEAVGRLARLVVPRLADWSIVTLQDEDGRLHDVGSWHVDPDQRAAVARYAALRPTALTDASFLRRALEVGEPQAVRSGAVQHVRQVLLPGPAQEQLVALAPVSLLVLPLIARGRTVGVLSLYSGADGPRLSDELIGVAAEAAARAALVVDNARAYTDALRAREQAEAANRRLALLARVTEALSSTLDSSEAVARLARLVVPHLGDWGVVTVQEDDGTYRDLGYAHRDPARLQDVAAYCEAQQRLLDPHSAVATVLRTGVRVVIPDLAALGSASERTPAVGLAAGMSHELRRRLAPSGLAVLPLALRGRTLGALTLVTGPDRGPHDEDEILAATEVARRAAIALDNIRLFRRQRRLAEELQLSLLTEPPQPDHVEIAVRYVPAAHEAQVGGDWYDAFLQQDGSTMLAIGDVVGHDSRAAAAMGQVRTLLRGIAYDSSDGPAQVLARLDAALVGLQVQTTATVVLARLEQDPADLPSGRRRLRWSNAGHPPPMLRGPNGTVRLLAAPDEEADLLLGIDLGASRRDLVEDLEAGSLVFLYTDGLVERRGVSLDDGLERLRAALEISGHLPLQELCDTVLRQLMPREAEDDVALVAVRLHPEDRPRPVRAGPTRIPPTVP